MREAGGGHTVQGRWRRRLLSRTLGGFGMSTSPQTLRHVPQPAKYRQADGPAVVGHPGLIVDPYVLILFIDTILPVEWERREMYEGSVRDRGG